jgi:predicted signal transduction protein with EAL and GGDEF domain
LEKAIAEALETNEAMSLMLTDIDHFKTFNDNFGHLTDRRPGSAPCGNVGEAQRQGRRHNGTLRW